MVTVFDFEKVCGISVTILVNNSRHTYTEIEEGSNNTGGGWATRDAIHWFPM